MFFTIDLVVVLEQSSAPALITPEDNAEVGVSDLQFDWQDSFRPRYRIQLAHDVAFSDILFDQTVRYSEMMLLK